LDDVEDQIRTDSGGIAHGNSDEAKALAQPADLMWWHRPQIADVFAGVGGSAASELRVEPVEAVNSRRELYARRDQSGLSRLDFYRYFFETNGTDSSFREI
jgi:hypothetical protein